MKFKTIIAAAAMALVGFAANASTINGSISFIGIWSSSSGTIAGQDINDVSVSFASVGGASGDLASPGGVTAGSAATFKTLNLNPLNTPITDFWTVNGTSAAFDLTSITSISYTGSSIVLTGFGSIKLNGYTNTTANWSFSGDAGGGVLVFSSGTTAVPVPASALLMLTGIGGLAAVRRRRRKA